MYVQHMYIMFEQLPVSVYIKHHSCNRAHARTGFAVANFTFSDLAELQISRRTRLLPSAHSFTFQIENMVLDTKIIFLKATATLGTATSAVGGLELVLVVVHIFCKLRLTVTLSD